MFSNMLAYRPPASRSRRRTDTKHAIYREEMHDISIVLLPSILYMFLRKQRGLPRCLETNAFCGNRLTLGPLWEVSFPFLLCARGGVWGGMQVIEDAMLRVTAASQSPWLCSLLLFGSRASPNCSSPNWQLAVQHKRSCRSRGSWSRRFFVQTGSSMAPRSRNG